MFYVFSAEGETGSYGINKTIDFKGIDIIGILGNPIYNFSIFILTYPIYFLIYFIIFLIRRVTDFRYSIIHFIMFMLNIILLCINAENRFLIPLSGTCFIFFILNIFKTTKNISLINKIDNK
ncbi:hypothetical protein QFZ37_003067 [Chryseobacterium ginsenosidimutans]|nr:hypothetical protein [Chryseobacterium ginsenosidimutans]